MHSFKNFTAQNPPVFYSACDKSTLESSLNKTIHIHTCGYSCFNKDHWKCHSGCWRSKGHLNAKRETFFLLFGMLTYGVLDLSVLPLRGLDLSSWKVLLMWEKHKGTRPGDQETPNTPPLVFLRTLFMATTKCDGHETLTLVSQHQNKTYQYLTVARPQRAQTLFFLASPPFLFLYFLFSWYVVVVFSGLVYSFNLGKFLH